MCYWRCWLQGYSWFILQAFSRHCILSGLQRMVRSELPWKSVQTRSLYQCNEEGFWGFHLAGSQFINGIPSQSKVSLDLPESLSTFLTGNSFEGPTERTRNAPESACQVSPPDAALRQGTPALSSEGGVPPFQRFRKAIRSREEVTSWYCSRSSRPMDGPSVSPYLYSEALCENDLFIHTCSNGIQAWIWNGETWVPIKEGDPHPHITGYCVSFLEKGEPSWVTKKTIVTYRSKRRR